MRKNFRGFAVTFLIVIFAILAIGYLFLEKDVDKRFVQPVIENISKVNKEPTPTPFAFQEMTIPYLRSKTYLSSLGEMQKVRENPNYTSFLTSYNSDGFKVYGLLTKPRGEMPKDGYPAVVFIHGYIPPENYQTKVNYASYVDYLAKNGFVIFKIDLRGHGNSEGEPGGGYYSGDYVIDTLNAVSALRNSDFVNPDNIGLWGHSMAGNIVLRSFVADLKIPAVVVWAGAGFTYSDLQEYRIEDTSYRPPPSDSERAKERQKLRDMYGNFDPNNWFWKQVPATNYLDGVTGAVQLNHSKDDNVVSIEYSRNLNSILNQANIRHELNEYAAGGHNLSGITFNQAMQKTVEFFMNNLSSG
ncbi:hypothetical protein A2962_02250 [Candidatus Woesebacteria bacterium RIFCSPLOWO2_01_FULL_39_61]|uniref:Serine aminopeptidase S33 domain-containing protein n=1 Tax=Candidatus Woesebacteria bacterium RIFCSPHIGHO2_02_FULL_39_13 TaxID=1802505 RepID=A0A1F7Z319_9BACT|nr:MAG: hypothetical protein A2692_01265 [Candidatus Woesebacteria bacterium RIFCSPHIGHO2_01_FULL_39_95]OGM33982.1 MAG: hypothetical protein A3D01_03555 [Candidatus Woesebacteria bacterium RIFCSPHIGHO2_02_FULL_39_13]OGM38240.1 MAG: hypothetical protein A3E13_05665 [Candidatus Woesebacteria bacterium RIFCSPHIGHO2_12_FULL_40_20]OGM66946.1 MAG: hypothetical protein A2962_02250 [Candidatus Woesebacteria bacterium RIFCSPLOWO2_01_FULL_39_61]OGM74844.1 MAG: hypothetical protein A3H19_02525 [Candidatus